MTTTPDLRYAVTIRDIAAGHIRLTSAGEIIIDVASPFDKDIEMLLSNMREHGIVDLGQAVLKEPIFLEGKHLFYALWKRLMAKGYELRRIETEDDPI